MICPYLPGVVTCPYTLDELNVDPYLCCDCDPYSCSDCDDSFLFSEDDV